MRLPLLFAVIFTAVASPAVGAGDADRGNVLVNRWCTSCHAVDELHAGRGVAPPFATIAKNSGRSRSWVRAWLMSPHPSMPDLSLSRTEIDDIVAYFDSLVPPKGN